MISTNFKMALQAIRTARWRSFLTMLGVVVGVSSVLTVVSIGQGVKRQISNHVAVAGAEIVTVRPGRLVERDQRGRITKVNYQSVVGAGSLTEQDLGLLQQSKQAAKVVPFGLMSGAPQVDSASAPRAVVVGTSPDALNVLKRKIAFGSFFNGNDTYAPAGVIGPKLAEELFKENAPIGRTLSLRGQEVIIRGVLQSAQPNPGDLGIDYNYALFLPYEYAKKVGGNQLQIYQVLVQPAPGVGPENLRTNLSTDLRKAHGGQEDFTVLQAADNVAIASNALNLMTSLVAAMAGVSLLVGGIGIMNIMFVAVSERTHEVGVRKSIGATNAQIRGQFLMEAAVISAVGGVFGVLVSLLANYFLRIGTSLEPALDPLLMTIAVIGALFLGVLFGLAPAVRAARKDPIEALRRI